MSTEQVARSGETLDPSADPDVFRNATVAYFRDHDAVFELRVQLCSDLDSMPIEDASVRWPEADNPYVTVATLPRQDALSPARVRFVEDRMSFRPSHSLETHRPLGSLMRARLCVYSALASFRMTQDDGVTVEPATLDALPD